MLYVFKNLLTKAIAIYIVLVALMLAFFVVDSAIAGEIPAAALTVPLNESGKSLTLTTQQFMQGQQKFNNSCAQCHIDGGTKTNPDVDLGQSSLTNATPSRDNVEGIINYLKEPTTYDGLGSLAELHPSIQRADLFPRMGGLTEDDLGAIAGYILAKPQIIGEQWAGGKTKR